MSDLPATVADEVDLAPPKRPRIRRKPKPKIRKVLYREIPHKVNGHELSESEADLSAHQSDAEERPITGPGQKQGNSATHSSDSSDVAKLYKPKANGAAASVWDPKFKRDHSYAVLG